MKLIAAFFRLVRWPNLVFIALTQLLFVYCIVKPVFSNSPLQPNVHGLDFVLISLSSILIAAAGYIINDYFDLNIDQVNKPDKLVVEKIIKRRWTIVWHIVLSTAGVAIGFYVDFTSRIWLLGFSNAICVTLLFIYSTSLKRRLLIGNILISLLTAWVILVVAWCEYNHLIHLNNGLRADKILRETFLYAGFAFIISLIREAVKDMEDVEGDRRYGCKTMPIVWGINATKVFVAVWLVVLIAVLIIVQVYALRLEWYWSVVYCMLAIVIPLIYIFRKLFAAKTSADYHKLSTLIKLVMFTGILSMIFFKIY
ncbi:ubiquinone biosynthesis protein UbiA [Panacibacter ginsenosidivorans]|uniref:Ubiquinone biosynthesis protein UbiA n=1 Tax=Panacibacter ginsenosidivorans TaxID=1813871 RepID=A0A5B8V5G4_9BACT|nr:geranylgeranylglycerol-phosphate geranylgeranyltransferase [Panacibacter ginsenosidivorans]QEC66452.1 ubiquinone biosynthesis protein UbiA [Panacibacter ginsenosidivorans]